MYNLLLNENMKIYRRWRTWIMVAILILIMALFLISQYSDVRKLELQDWRTQAEQQIKEAEKMIADADRSKGEVVLDAEMRKMLENDIKYQEYRLKNNIAPTEQSLWGVVLFMSAFVSLVSIFVVIIAADSLAGEFSGGTIKLLLLQPASRSKILLAKYLSVFVYALFMVALVMLVAFIAGAIFYGFDGASMTYLNVSETGEYIERNMILHTLTTYGLQCVMLVFVATIAFLISSVFRSSSMAISIAIGIQFFAPLITQLSLEYSWAKYLLFVHMDLTQYLNDTPLIKGVDLPFAISVLAIYFIVLNGLTWFLFHRRDIA